MTLINESIRIFPLDIFNYPKFRGKIIELYLHAFTTGEYAQYITPEWAESDLDETLRTGFGSMAFSGDRLVGISLATPLAKDNDFPRDECPSIPIDKALYIAETMVHTDFRGQGIAFQMIDNILRKANDIYDEAVIRVWSENKPALTLYEKMGFTQIAFITQTKHRSTKETFQMKKIYLHRVLRHDTK